MMSKSQALRLQPLAASVGTVDTVGEQDFRRTQIGRPSGDPSLLAAMNILAFLYHTWLSFTDERYRLIRATLPTRQTFFDDLRALTQYLLFANWDALMDFMMRGLQIGTYAKPP